MIDLSPFCRAPTEPTRYPGIVSPWILGGWEYATDGRILVRQPTRKTTVPDDKKYPEAAPFFTRFPRCTVPWPQFPAYCPHCNKRVMGSPYPDIEIAGRQIGANYYEMIQSLGEVRYSRKGGREDRVAFECGKLQGLLEPLEWPSSRAEEGKQ